LRAALWALRGEESGEGWSLGAYAEWGIRFERVDDLELAAKGGVSAGPALRRRWVWDGSRGARPRALAFSLAAPVTGPLHGHQLGGRGELWADWGPWPAPLATRLGLRARGGASLLSWSEPEGSLWLDWSAGLALTITGR
ncbi:MAG: hypothetical protein IT285_09835, partial [Bdellovibrionales bacterium]|nr:hypothetical protein [Bdellovibrionales bacterium]